MEPDATPDLVGRTSARLLADGVGRSDRLEALRLLAVLDASTDATGRVRRPLDDLAAEFELPPMGVLRSLDHLERAGAIQREGGTVVLLDRDDDGVGGLSLADFLDDVRASFDGTEAPVRDRSLWLARAGAAFVAVAAAIGVLVLVPGQPAVNQPVASRTSTSVAAPTTATEAPSEPGTAPTSSPVTSRAPFDTAPPTSAVPSADTTVVAASQCPVGSPAAEIIGNVIRISNPSTADVVVTRLAIAGVPSVTPITVPAGQSVDRALPAQPSSVAIDEWQWADPATERSCP